MESPEARERRLARNRAYYQAHKAEIIAKVGEWQRENRDKVRAAQVARGADKEARKYQRERRKGLKGPFGPDDGSDWQERNRAQYLVEHRENTNRWRREVTLEALTHYSGGTPKCHCCGESVIELLTLDHINQDGAKHRRETKMHRAPEWAKKNGWPAIFRVACYSCNIGAYRNGGVCPHERSQNV